MTADAAREIMKLDGLMLNWTTCSAVDRDPQKISGTWIFRGGPGGFASLRYALSGHQVETAYERGWAELTNGELLASAEAAGFDLLITTDKGIRYQQNRVRVGSHGSC